MTNGPRAPPLTARTANDRLTEPQHQLLRRLVIEQLECREPLHSEILGLGRRDVPIETDASGRRHCFFVPRRLTLITRGFFNAG